MKKIILFLISIILFSVSNAQGRLNLINIVRPLTTPMLTISPTTLPNFVNQTGTASSTQTITYTVANLTSTFSITAVAGFEYSNNGGSSYSASFSGLTISGTLLVRVAAGTAAGSYSGNIQFVSTGATTKNCAITATVNPNTPFLNTNVSTVPALTTGSGTSSLLDSFSITGGNLTANATITFPSGFEGSLDKSSFGTTKTITQSGGTLVSQPVWVYARIASTTGVGTYSDTIKSSSTGAVTANVLISGTVNASSTKDSIRVQFDTTSVNQAGWTIMKGAPNLNVITAIGGNNNTITVSTISTSINNWKGSSLSTYPNNGTDSGTVWTYASNVMRECYFQYLTSYNSSYPQIKISGLKTSATYTLQLTGSIATSISGYDCHGEYRVLGNNLLAVQLLNAQPSGVENKTSSLTFPGPGDGATTLIPDGTGAIYIFFNPQAGASFGALCAFILKEN